jgi:crotonobetainyl-CoA:carnitine CoA-transferase CaiB-like acyl-CoA transferase
VPAAPVNHLDGAFAEAPVAERDMIVEYDHPDVGRVRMPGNPIKMAGAPATPSRPAPRLGEHTDEVLQRLLGLTRERIAALRARNVIR